MQYSGTVGESVPVQCPWCGEVVEVWVEPDTSGSMVQDCDVCCRPWTLRIEWNEDRTHVEVHATRS